MVELAHGLAEPFERIDTADAAALLTERYGIRSPELTRLDTERDDTFRVQSPDGAFVLKVSHPADDPLLVNLQTAAMAFAAEIDPELPLQRVLPTLDGEIEADVTGTAGETRVVRVLTWLPGTLLSEVVASDEQRAAFGERAGQLTAALEDFRHPAGGRALAWDVEQLPALADLVRHAPEVRREFDAFDADAVAALPHQIVHNDLNHHNVVVDPHDPAFVTGILDFGDTVHTARVIDLAVAASYLVEPERGWASVAPIVDGYRRRVALTDAELKLLPALVRARLVQRILLTTWMTRETGGYLASVTMDRTRAQLASLS